MIKVNQDLRSFIAQCTIELGDETVKDVKECVRICREDGHAEGGPYSVATRRFSHMGYGESPNYAQALRDVVVVIIIEKSGMVENLEEVLSVERVDIIQ